jgi:hypothetical protein
MPCNTTQRSEISLGKINQGIMEAAFARLQAGNPYKSPAYINVDGRTVSVRFQDGKALIAGTSDVSSVESYIKRLYSSQVVLQTAAAYKWHVKDTGTYKFQIQKG